MEKYLSEADINNAVLTYPGIKSEYNAPISRVPYTLVVECIIKEQRKRTIEEVFDYIFHNLCGGKMSLKDEFFLNDELDRLQKEMEKK